MDSALNSTQREILKLFSNTQSDQDLKEIKSLLLAYLAEKAVREADKAFDATNAGIEIFEKWKLEHFRKSA